MILDIVLFAFFADTAGLMDRLISAQKANDNQAQRYTYVEHADFFTYTPALRKDRSEKSEVIFVEGLQYKKLVERNGQPLSPAEREHVEQQMNETAEHRRRNRAPVKGGRISFGNDHADLGSLDELTTLFDWQMQGEAEVRGRKAWIVELTPKRNLKKPTEHERQVLKFRKTLWIDQQDHVLLRITHTVIDKGMFAKPGAFLTIDYEKLPQGPYVHSSVAVDIHRQIGREIRPSGRIEYRHSDFKKFNAESTITIQE